MVLGLVAGVLSGLFGIDGGGVIVPALMLIARMPAIDSTGTSPGALLLPVGILGAWEYHWYGNLNIGAALLIAVGLLAGAWFGARFAHRLEPVQLKRLFAIFLVLVAARTWWST